MRTRLFLALALVLVAAPAAPAQDPPRSPEEGCTAQITEQRAMSAMQQALRKPLPPTAGETIAVRVAPCGPGRLVLRVRHATKTGVILAQADRTLTSTATATMRLRTTKHVERYRGKRLRLHLRAIFVP
jgi:hypothetical protein